MQGGEEAQREPHSVSCPDGWFLRTLLPEEAHSSSRQSAGGIYGNRGWLEWGRGDGFERSSCRHCPSPGQKQIQKRAAGANPHPPRLAPQETSGYSSQVLSAEKGALRPWGAVGLRGHKSYKRSHVPCSLQVELCCGFICSSQQPLNCALSVPIFTGTERSTGQSHR